MTVLHKIGLSESEIDTMLLGMGIVQGNDIIASDLRRCIGKIIEENNKRILEDIKSMLTMRFT
ncbi:hypothetical protein D3C75_1238200 [compost metagenome]